MIEYCFMNEAHIRQIAELEMLCFSQPWSENSVRSELKNPLSLWIVAMDGERLAGYVGSQSVMGWADMMNLAVHPDYRCKGIAKSLVTCLISRLADNAVSCLTLEVRITNLPAIRLYTKLGFVEVGRRPGYYHDPKEDALILRKELSV